MWEIVLVAPLVECVPVLSDACRDDLAVVCDTAARPEEIDDVSATGRATLCVVITWENQVLTTVG